MATSLRRDPPLAEARGLPLPCAHVGALCHADLRSVRPAGAPHGGRAVPALRRRRHGRVAPQVSRVTLSPTVEQPHVCLQCGAATHRRTRVRVHGPRPLPVQREPVRLPLWFDLLTGGLGCLLSVLGGGVRLLEDALTTRRPTISLRVRQCAECGLSGTPPAHAPDYDARRITFEAHPRFVEALAHDLRHASATRSAGSALPRGDDEARPVSPS